MLTLLIITLISFPLFSAVTIDASKVLHRYQPQENIDKMEAELRFWNTKYMNTPSQKNIYAIKMAIAHEALFSLTGSIEDLKKSETLLTQVLEKEILNRSGVQRMLAKNMISQHRFCEALELVLSARESGRDAEAADLMLYDIYMELGEEALANEHLDYISNKSSFDYLIRLAKWYDYFGQLDKAIDILEEAKEVAVYSKNTIQLSWIYSNLGDFYGHQGDYQQSKEHFVKALEINPSDWYSLKGLAYMSWTLNNDYDTATKMINTIHLYNVSPAIGWLKNEILISRQASIAIAEKSQLIEEISRPEYSSMYDHYLYEYAIEDNDYKLALSIAERQVKERPTAHSYAMMANALHHNGQKQQAKEVSDMNVLNKTYEPNSLRLIYPVYKGESVIYQKLKTELMTTKYELGINAYNQILAI